MSRHKFSHRRRASLPLAPHVVAALQRVRQSFSVMNSIALCDDIPDPVRLGCYLAAARDLSAKVISFVLALECSVDDPTQPPSMTIKE